MDITECISALTAVFGVILVILSPRKGLQRFVTSVLAGGRSPAPIVFERLGLIVFGCILLAFAAFGFIVSFYFL